MTRKILLLVLSFSVADAQTTESFDILLKTLSHTYSEEERDIVRSHWEGMKTWEGFNMVVGEILKNTSGNRRLYSFSILEHLELPSNQMVDRLLAGAKITLEEDTGRLPSHLVILERFPQDDRIINWLAGLLNDQRLVPDPPKKRGEDRSGGQTARVCDCASGTITRMLIARKQIPYEGLGVGDPSLDYNYPGRDRYNLAVAKKLNELGFHVKEPTSKPTEPSNPRPEKPRIEIKAETSIDSDQKLLAIETKTPERENNSSWIIGTVASAFGLILALLALRKMQSTERKKAD